MKAQKIRGLAVLFGLGVCNLVFANTVRTVLVNNEAMAPIYLRMGKSTILRFVEKPKKVVVGNQNYYGLEFIENDVAIQSLGAVATNLFVYTEHRTYGFLLTPGERYDDLVFVRWRYPGLGMVRTEKPVSAKAVALHIAFLVGENLRVTVDNIQGPSTFGLHLIDCTIENVGKTDAVVSTLLLQAIRNGKRLNNQNAVIERDKLKPHEKTKARIILKIEAKEDFSVEGRFGQSAGKAVIGRKYL